MKTKIGIYLDADVARSFRIALRQPGATKSKLVNAALRTYLSPLPVPGPGDQVLQHLKRLAKRLRQLHRNTEVVSETLALFVRYFLMITPPIQEDERPAAEALGRERYVVFIKEIAKRLASDKGMAADVICTIVRTHPHLVAEAMTEARRADAIGDLFPANGRAGQPAEGASHA